MKEDVQRIIGEIKRRMIHLTSICFNSTQKSYKFSLFCIAVQFDYPISTCHAHNGEKRYSHDEDVDKKTNYIHTKTHRDMVNSNLSHSR